MTASTTADVRAPGIASKGHRLLTIMSYHGPGPLLTAGNQARRWPLDILVIQHIYGANTNFPCRRRHLSAADDSIVRTIWDARGPIR